MYKWLAALFALIFVSIIVMADRGTLPPIADLVRRTPGGDKIAHFLLIGLLAFLAEMATGVARFRILGLRIPAAGLIIATLVTAEEVSQLWFPNRTFSLLDLAADYAGILTAAAAAIWITNARSNRPRPIDP